MTDPVPPAEEHIVVLQHNSAVDFLALAYPTLRRHEASANIVLAHALKRAPAEYVLTDCQFHSDTVTQLPPSSPPIPATDFWLTVWSHPAELTPVLEMVLTCLHSSLGNYPIFLFTPVEKSSLSPQWLGNRVGELAAHLRACVEPERVFSVFGVASLVAPFAKVWTELTGFQTGEELYRAYFAFCTPHTFKAPISASIQHTVRKAAMTDAEEAGKLCQEFANSSEYPLSIAQAMAEARELIHKGQLWVYETAGREVASICAVTRSSLRVSGITKVYTTPNWRRNGFAQELVQEVTGRLFECGKHSVVLYVGCKNSAKRVYERVGFVSEDSDVCLELGFVGANVGHW